MDKIHTCLLRQRSITTAMTIIAPMMISWM
jgi:hypothetical protein